VLKTTRCRPRHCPRRGRRQKKPHPACPARRFAPGARSTGYPPDLRPTTGDAARPLDDGRTRRQTGSGASCVRSWVAVSSVAYHALRLHRLRPPRIAVQPSHVPAFLSRPLGCRICSTTLPVCPGSMSATASWIAGCGSCRSRADVVACDQAKQQGLDVTCVEAMRTAFAAVCTSLSPRQGGVRRPPPRRARGCNLPRLRPRLFGCLLPQGG